MDYLLVGFSNIPTTINNIQGPLFLQYVPGTLAAPWPVTTFPYLKRPLSCTSAFS